MNQNNNWFDFNNDDNSEQNINDPDSLWQDMPEFIQDKKDDCYAKIIFRFDTEYDLKQFSNLVGQKLTKKTKSIRFPFKKHRLETDQKFFYVDEENES